MFIYILLIFLSLLLLSLRQTVAYKSIAVRNSILIAVILLLFLLTIFRSTTVGTDYNAYYGYYFTDSMTLKAQYIESGYILLNEVSQKLGFFLIIPIFEFIVSFFGMFSLSVVVHSNKFSFLAFYILTYVYMQSFNALRQFIAIGFICFGCCFIFSQNKYKYLAFIFFILLAYEFHSSSLLMIALPLLLRVKISSKLTFISMILTIILFVSGLGIKLAQPLISMNSHYAIKYSGQASSFLSSTGNKGFIQFAPVIIQFLFLFMYLVLNKPYIKNKLLSTNKLNFILTGYLAFLVLYSASGNGVIDRIQMFFYVFCILANCYFIDNKFDSGNKALVFKGTLIVFWIAYCALRLITNNANVVPYTFS